MGCHSLLQGIFLTERSNRSLLHCRWILYHLSHKGSHQETQICLGIKFQTGNTGLSNKKRQNNFKGIIILTVVMVINISKCVQIVQLRHIQCIVYHSYPNETVQMHVYIILFDSFGHLSLLLLLLLLSRFSRVQLCVTP